LLEVSLIGAAAEPKLLESKVVAAAREPDKYIVSTVVPLADLPPVDYQVRATVGVVGQPAGTLTATLRKIK
jgi:hypothetical protein